MAIATFKQQIMAKYECKDLGALGSIICMEVVLIMDDELFLSQSQYIQGVLGRFKTHLPGPSKRLNGDGTPLNHRIRLHKNEATYI